MVQSLSCYFEPEHKQFYSVIQLGTNICGYKRIVHGRNASSPLDAIVMACLNGRVTSVSCYSASVCRWAYSCNV